MPDDWQPRLLVLQNGDLKTGLTGPWWNQFIQTQNYAGLQVRLRNILQPALTFGAYHLSDNTIQPAAITAVDTGSQSNVALLVESDKLTSWSAPTAASVGVASAEAVPAKTGRRYLLLKNTSANTISLAFDQAAVLSSGITLQAGEAYEMSAAAGNLTDSQVRAIASVAASNLAIQEV